MSLVLARRGLLTRIPGNDGPLVAGIAPPRMIPSGSTIKSVAACVEAARIDAARHAAGKSM